MAVFSIKLLAEGQLSSSKGVLYTVPASTTAIIKTISYVNTDSAARTVNLYVKIGTSRRIIPMNMSLGIGYMMVYDDELTLPAGALIEGDASAATVVDFCISGIEKSA